MENWKAVLSIDEAECAIKFFLETYNVKPVVTWIQKYLDDGTREDIQKKLYTNAFGLMKTPVGEIK